MYQLMKYSSPPQMKKPAQKDFARRAAPDAHQAAHQHRHQHHAAAVNGAVGADEEATVDEPVVLDVFQRDLHHPAQHGEHKVQHDQLAQRVQFIRGTSRVSSSDIIIEILGYFVKKYKKVLLFC